MCPGFHRQWRRTIIGNCKMVLTGTFPFAFSASLFSNKGALLHFPPISTARGSGFSWRLAAEGDDGARGGVSNSSPELNELLAVVDRPIDERIKQIKHSVAISWWVKTLRNALLIEKATFLTPPYYWGDFVIKRHAHDDWKRKTNTCDALLGTREIFNSCSIINNGLWAIKYVLVINNYLLRNSGEVLFYQ